MPGKKTKTYHALKWADDEILAFNLLQNNPVVYTKAGYSTLQKLAVDNNLPVSFLEKIKRHVGHGEHPNGSGTASPATPGGKPNAAPEDPKEKKADEKTPPKPAVRFAAGTLTCEYTPIMVIARQAAVEKWGWASDMKFEDFIDNCLYFLFKDRGIILQGYIVLDDVEKAKN